MTYMLCLFNDGFHICYVCSMMHCFCRQIKQWRIDDGRQISIYIGGVSAIAIVHITNAIYLQLTLSKSTIATVYPTNLMCRQWATERGSKMTANLHQMCPSIYHSLHCLSLQKEIRFKWWSYLGCFLYVKSQLNLKQVPILEETSRWRLMPETAMFYDQQ